MSYERMMKKYLLEFEEGNTTVLLGLNNSFILYYGVNALKISYQQADGGQWCWLKHPEKPHDEPLSEDETRLVPFKLLAAKNLV